MGIDYVIFTDGSVHTSPNHKKSYAGYGVVLYNTQEKIFASFGGELGSRTIAFAELWAIYSGISKIASIVPKDIGESKNVLVLTDSKLCVDSLNYYIPGWIDNERNGVWYSSNNTRVKNQRIYKQILSVEENNPQIRVKVGHINSHLLTKDHAKITEKLKEHGLNANEESARVIIKMNAMADDIASGYSKRLQRLGNQFLTLRPTEEYF